ncbi:metallophosphoesterase [Colwellia sp. RSH04]|uniref:metallophosphoesterase family protein n=1 Tax=Colwellia sp. RSH04 TaxID=2305464 RepID=UPI000E5969B9|nr:metallophosphoesterase [Colwellia sp. RSH04]RHW76492.1 hypothetical protein D1094_09295 [Colwellia sp. RSH04]
MLNNSFWSTNKLQNIIFLVLVPLFLFTTFTLHVTNSQIKTIGKANISQPNNWQHILILNDINGSYGDIGYSDTIKRLVNHAITAWQVELVVSPGDLVAGQSLNLTEHNINSMWQGFHQQILSPFTKKGIPFATSFGNHDGSKYLAKTQAEIHTENKANQQGDGKSHQQQYKYSSERNIANQFWLNNQPKLNYLYKEHFPFFYSFEFANTTFVIIDASGFQMSVQELTLIENMLANNQNNKPLMVIGHLPLTGIAINRNKFGEVLQESDTLMALFKQYKVDIYISGHQHVYFPALHQGVFLLNSGGTPPRSLVGQQNPPRSSVTVLSINTDNQKFHTTTYDLETLKVIDESSIIGHVKGYPFDLTKSLIQSKH